MSRTLDEGLQFIDGIAEICEEINIPDAMQSSADAAKAELGEMMNSQVSPDGTAYVPNAPATVKAKGHAKALFDTNELYGSVVGAGSGHIEEIVGDGWTLGTEHEKEGEPIALYMQEGTKNADGTTHVPARPFIGVTEKMADAAAEAAADELMKQIAEL